MSDQQSFVSHLIELRSRLIKAVVVLLIIVIIQLPFAGKIYTIIARPVMAYLPEGSSMIATGVLSPFLTPFKMVFILGIIIAMPYILYQIWAFIAPGLYKNEKRIARPLLFSSIFLLILLFFLFYSSLYHPLHQLVLIICPTSTVI